MSSGKKKHAADGENPFPKKASKAAITLWDFGPQLDTHAERAARAPRASKFIAQFSDSAGREYMKATENINGELSLYVKLPKKEFATQISASFPMPNDTIIIHPTGDDGALEYTLTVLSVEGFPGPRTTQVKITVYTNEIQ